MLYQTNNPHGGDIYTEPIRLDFSASINPLGTPAQVINAMKQALEQSACSYPDPCCRKAVSSISSHEDVSPDHILMGNGAAELIYSYCTAAAPRKALIAEPTFSEYEAALAGNGCEITRHFLRQEDDFMLGESFLSAVREQKPDAVFLCDPNNPTGRLIPDNYLYEIVNLCESFKIRLFLDECFLDLTGKKSSLYRHLDKFPHLFILKALTKSYGLAGVRVGYCLTSDSGLLQHMSRTVQPWNVSVIAQAAVSAVFDGSDLLKEAIKLIGTERIGLTKALHALGFQVCPSEANYILFRAPSGLDADLRKKGIAIRNCSNFHGLGAGWYRIAVRKHEENDILIRTIRQIQQEKGK